MKTGFTDGLFGRGVQETREVLERGVVEPPAEVRRLLGIEGPIYRIATRRLAEGVPVSSDESFVPAGLLPGIEEQDLGGFALFAAIQERGTRKVFRMRQTVEITTLTDREAEIARGGGREAGPGGAPAPDRRGGPAARLQQDRRGRGALQARDRIRADQIMSNHEETTMNTEEART